MHTEREDAALSITDHVGWLINRLNSVRAERLKAGLRERGLSPRGLAVLTAIHELPLPVSQQEIADVLALDQASVAIVADDLHRSGLISRDRDPRNRRRYAVALTDEGTAVLADSQVAVSEVEAAMLLGLDDGEADILRDLLRRVAKEHGIV